MSCLREHVLARGLVLFLEAGDALLQFLPATDTCSSLDSASLPTAWWSVNSVLWASSSSLQLPIHEVHSRLCPCMLMQPWPAAVPAGWLRCAPAPASNRHMCSSLGGLGASRLPWASSSTWQLSIHEVCIPVYAHAWSCRRDAVRASPTVSISASACSNRLVMAWSFSTKGFLMDSLYCWWFLPLPLLAGIHIQVPWDAMVRYGIV